MEQRDKHSPRLFGRGTRRAVAVALLLVIGLFFLPLLIPRGEPLYAPGDPDSSAAPSDSSAQPLPTSGAKDRGRAVRLQTGDGQVLLLVVDGRQPGYSIGCTMGDLADIMERYGAEQACNLDGGSSSIMYYNGRKITRPSAGDKQNGRRLPNAFVVSAR